MVVSYGSRRPDSRRDRRRAKGASRRPEPESTYRTFLVVAGLFFLVLLLLVAALALFG
jgi:hypothetical protein